MQKWREAKSQLEGVLGGCGGPGRPHELHVHCVDCRTPLLNCCNAAGDTKGALAHLTVMISAMRAILGDPAVWAETWSCLEIHICARQLPVLVASLLISADEHCRC